MASLLLKNARLIDVENKKTEQKDVYIVNGKIDFTSFIIISFCFWTLLFNAWKIIINNNDNNPIAKPKAVYLLGNVHLFHCLNVGQYFNFFISKVEHLLCSEDKMD